MVIPLTPATIQEAGLMDADSVIKLNQTLPDAIEAEQEARIAKIMLMIPLIVLFQELFLLDSLLPIIQLM